MSFHDTVERSKLNQAMYKKLKKYIINKRKQQVEQKEQDDHYKRIILEKLKRKRQAQIDHETMESLQKELIEATKRRDDLREQKNSLFTRFKQLANDESILKDKQKSEVQQMASASLPRSYHLQNIPDQMSTSMSNASIPTSMLGYTPNKIESINDNNPVPSNHSPMAMSVNDLATAIRYSGLSPAILEALYKNNNTQRILNQAVVSSYLNNGNVGLTNPNAISTSTANSILANSNLNESALAALFANINNPSVSALLAPSLLQVDLHGSNTNDNSSCLNQPSNQSLNSLLAQLEKYGGGINAAALAALSQQQESIRQAPNNSQRILESLKQLSNNNPGCFDNYNSSQLGTNAAAFNSLVNSTVMGSSLLPPAPTSYRGSITTGQSAQNIQLQVYQQQQQQQQQQHMLMAAAAKLVNSVNHSQSSVAAQQQQQQQQHQVHRLSSDNGIQGSHLLAQHHGGGNVLQIGQSGVSGVSNGSGRHDPGSLYSGGVGVGGGGGGGVVGGGQGGTEQHSPFYGRTIVTPTGQQVGQQTAAALAAAANYSNQAQMAHHLSAHAALSSSQNYRQSMPQQQQQQQPPHSVHNSYF